MNKSHKKLIKIVTLCFPLLFFISCQTIPKREPVKLSRKLLDSGKMTSIQLAEFFLSQNPDYEDPAFIYTFAQLYIDESKMEGINSDVAFAQMCLETGYLKYGNLVKANMNNFCGLGAENAEHPGESFPTQLLGIRAHIQHLQAYATNEDVKLNNELVDPRYNWPHKAIYAQTIWDLTGKWATDPEYGQKIEEILCNMEKLFPKT